MFMHLEFHIFRCLLIENVASFTEPWATIHKEQTEVHPITLQTILFPWRLRETNSHKLATGPCFSTSGLQTYRHILIQILNYAQAKTKNCSTKPQHVKTRIKMQALNFSKPK